MQHKNRRKLITLLKIKYYTTVNDNAQIMTNSLLQKTNSTIINNAQTVHTSTMILTPFSAAPHAERLKSHPFVCSTHYNVLLLATTMIFRPVMAVPRNSGATASTGWFLTPARAGAPYPIRNDDRSVYSPSYPYELPLSRSGYWTPP